ncbi:MAG: primosomal replication protein [Legionellaceae bacterium]|nr:primosomal replication protein [Legionellaceae bacterium]
MHVQELTEKLLQRLPELEWKFSQLPYALTLWHLPPGLFQTAAGKGYEYYLAEIKHDIELLQKDRLPASQWYLAKKIEQKIHIMIRLWVLQQKKPPQPERQVPVLQRLAKRQEWLQELEQSIQQLQQQLRSLEQQVEQLTPQHSPEWRLQLEHDIGKARQQLQVQQEQYQRASSVKSKDSRP